jgi:hypothetical protein
MQPRSPDTDDHRHRGPRPRGRGGLEAVRQRVRRFAFRTTLGPAGDDRPAASGPSQGWR